MAIPSQQDYNRCESGPVTRESDGHSVHVYIIHDRILYFTLVIIPSFQNKYLVKSPSHDASIFMGTWHLHGRLQNDFDTTI